MGWLDFSDPIVLLMVAAGLLVVFFSLSPQKLLERMQLKAQTESARLQVQVAQRDQSLLEDDTTTESRREVKKTGDLRRQEVDAAVDEELRKAEGLSKIRIAEIIAEDDAALRAAREHQKYEEERRGRVQAQRPGNSVPGVDGQEPRGSSEPAGNSGADGKAADRHRKPKPPVEDPSV